MGPSDNKYVRNMLNTKNAVSNAAQAFHYLRRARSPPSDATFLELVLSCEFMLNTKKKHHQEFED